MDFSVKWFVWLYGVELVVVAYEQSSDQVTASHRDTAAKLSANL